MTRAKDDLHLVVPQRFFVHGQHAQGDKHGDVMLEAHKIRVARGDYNIAEIHLADALELLVLRSRPALSDDRSPKDPY